jgi:RNA polymerase sigma factor (sigma-70 family)
VSQRLSQDQSAGGDGPAAPTDAELVERCLSGDSRAWDTVVTRYAGLVYSVPRRYRLPDDLCEDVFQSVFESLIRSLESIRDAQGLAKWLLTTAHRECWRTIRAARPALDEEALAGIPVNEPPDERLENWERRHRVHLALTRLGGPCERLLRALFLGRHERSYERIAEELGIPVGSIGPTRARCLRKLVEHVRELDPEEE